MALLLSDLLNAGKLAGDYRVYGRLQSDSLLTGILNARTGALITNLTHTGTLQTDALTSTNSILSNQSTSTAINAPNGGVSAQTCNFATGNFTTLTTGSQNVTGAATLGSLSVTNNTTLNGSCTLPNGSITVTNGSVTAGGTMHVQSTNDYNNTLPALQVDGGGLFKLGLSATTLYTPKANITTLNNTGGATIIGGASIDILSLQKTATIAGLTTASGGLSVATSCNITCPVTGVPSIAFTNSPSTNVYTSADSGASAAMYLQNGGIYAGGNSAFKSSLALLGGAVSSAPVTITDTTDATSTAASLVLNGGLLSKKTIQTTSTSSTSIVTAGGVSASSLGSNTVNVTSTADYNTTSQTGALTVSGGGYFAGTIGAGKAISLNTNSLICDAPTLPSASNIAGTAFRVRNPGTTSTRLTLANTASSAYYESSVNLFSLGVEDGSVANSERLNFGVNSSGGYLTHVGTGSGTVKPFNLMNGSVFTNGGSLNLAGTNDYSSATPTAASFYTSGGGFVSKTLAANALVTGSTIAMPNTVSLSTASNSATTSNIFRVRSNDSTNTTAIFSVANNAMGSNYYESDIALNALGANIGDTNYERLIMGVNTSGGYINHIAGGTGTVKTFNVLNGSVFTSGGSLALNNTNDANTTTPNASALYSAGGAYLTKGLVASYGNFNYTPSVSNTSSVWPLYSLAPNMQTGGSQTAFYSGQSMTTNNSAVINFTYTGSQSTSNTMGLGLYGSPNRLLINGSGQVIIPGTANATSTSSGALQVGGGMATNADVYAGGMVTAASAVDYTTNGSTYTASIATPGSVYVGKTIGLGGSTMTITSAISSTGSTQTGSASNSNILRLRSNDATNTNTRLSVANVALGSSYYDSSIVLWALGSSAASTNYERMIMGANASGGYLNYLFGGTGTLKPFNILGGSTFTSGGTLQLNTALTLGSTNPVTRIASPSATAAYTLTEPPAPPSANGMVLSSTTTGVQSWSYPELIFTGDGATAAPTPLPQVVKLYVLTQTLNSNSGQIAFYLTNNGLSGGTPLGTFAGIVFAARASAQSNTATLGPIATEAYRGTNGVVADVLVSKSTTIAVGGTAAGLQAAPTGTIVTCFAWIY